MAASPAEIKTSDINAPIGESWSKTHTNVINFKYTWIITNFTYRPENAGEVLKSSTFWASHYDQFKWCLNLYPKGESKSSQNVTLYLQLISENVKGKFSFSILNDKNEKTKKRTSALNYFSQGQRHGCIDFVDRNFLFDKANGLLPDDTLTIKCDITMVFDTIHISDQNSKAKIRIPECKIVQDLGILFDNAKWKDVTLIVGKCEIPAHKNILAARSAVFDAMFEHEMEESKLNRVTITDIDYEVVKEMLCYIYTGKVSNLSKVAADSLIAADKYALKDLKILCEIELCDKISVETAAETLILADLHSAENLKAHTLDFINAHIVDILETEGWKNMIATHTHLIKETVGEIATWNGPPRKRSKN